MARIRAGGRPDAADEITEPRSGGGDSVLVIGLVVLYLIAIGAVAVCVRAPGIVQNGNETTWDRAIFTSVNAATLSGFQQTVGVREMRAVGLVGPALLLALTIGGSLLSLIVGGIAASRILPLRHSARQIVAAALAAQALATFAGAAALSGRGNSAFDALFQAASAFGNSGLWIGATPKTAAAPTFLILLPLAVLGGLGLPVLIELSDAVSGRPRFSRNTRVVLTLCATAWLAGLAALLIAQIPAAAGGGSPAWHRTLASCAVAAINTRSTGLPFESPAAFTAAGQWILMALMLIGAGPAGNARGLGVTTLRQLALGVRDALKGRASNPAFGAAALWVVTYLLLMFLGVLVIVTTESQLPADRLLFLVISALSNVGLSHDPVSITGPGLLALSALMLAGRLAPLAFLFLLARLAPETDVLIG